MGLHGISSASSIYLWYQLLIWGSSWVIVSHRVFYKYPYRTVLIRMSEICQKVKEKKEKHKFSSYFQWNKRRLSTNLLNFIHQKATFDEQPETRIDAEFHALSNCAIRMSEICQKVKEKKEKQNFPHIFNATNENCRRIFSNLSTKRRFSQKTRHANRRRIWRSIELCYWNLWNMPKSEGKKRETKFSSHFQWNKRRLSTNLLNFIHQKIFLRKNETQ